MSTAVLKRAAVELEQDLFWSLVEWARQSRAGRNPAEALVIALGESFTLEEKWGAALLLDDGVRDDYLDEGVDWRDEVECLTWLGRQPLDVLLALPGVLRLAHDYARLIASVSGTIRIIRAVEPINARVAQVLRLRLEKRSVVGVAGVREVPYF